MKYEHKVLTATHCSPNYSVRAIERYLEGGWELTDIVENMSIDVTDGYTRRTVTGCLFLIRRPLPVLDVAESAVSGGSDGTTAL